MAEGSDEQAYAPGGDWRPWSVNVEVTLACDLRCRHCGSTAGRPRPAELSLAELATCFRDLAALGGDEVCLLGGEPLLRPDWRELCLAAGDAGLGLVLVTNGSRLDAATVAWLAGLSHLRRVGVSLDAADPAVHDAIRGRAGAHAKALRALWALRDAGVEAGAVTTLSRANLDQLAPLRDLLVGQDVTWQLQCVSLGGGRFPAEERLDRAQFYAVGAFIAACRRRYPPAALPIAGAHDLGYCSDVLGPTGELPDWHGCGAGLYTLGILSDGRVKGCLSQHDRFVEDSVRARPLRDIWADPARFARNRRFTPAALEGGCRGCPHGARCRAGCANVAWTTTGRDYDNPYCFHRIEREGGR